MTRVLLVDDHEIVRRGLAEIIAASGDLEIAGECGGEADLFALVESTSPDVVVMDVRMPGRGAPRSARICWRRIRI